MIVGKAVGPVTELADVRDLKSLDPYGSCGFKSRPGHLKNCRLQIADCRLNGEETAKKSAFLPFVFHLVICNRSHNYE